MNNLNKLLIIINKNNNKKIEKNKVKKQESYYLKNKEVNNYKFHYFNNSENIFFFVPPENKDLVNLRQYLINNKKKVISNCVSKLHYPYNINKINNDLQKIDFENNIFINYKIIIITAWKPTYGHIFESVFNLYNFFHENKYNEKGFKILIYVNKNLIHLIKLSKYLLGDNIIFSNDLPQDNLIIFPEVILIENLIGSYFFHRFENKELILKIRNYFEDNTIESYENIFISRKEDNNRNLKNLIQIEEFLKKNNFKIIYGDDISDIEKYNRIKNAKNIIITNGSALHILIYLESKSKIFCLNANSYLPLWRAKCKNEKELEQILKKSPKLIFDDFEKNLWKGITSKFNFNYIDSFNNIITDKQLQYIIENLN